MVPHLKAKFKATAPGSVTKTGRDYFWLLPTSLDEAVKGVREHASTGFETWQELKISLKDYFLKQVLQKEKLKYRHNAKKQYSLKSLRAYRATEWVKLFMEYKKMGWKPEPPNPLAHTDMGTTLKNYAMKGCNSEMEASARCIEKYSHREDLCQPWIKKWLLDKE